MSPSYCRRLGRCAPCSPRARWSAKQGPARVGNEGNLTETCPRSAEAWDDEAFGAVHDYLAADGLAPSKRLEDTGCMTAGA